jgi:ferredoxin
VSRFVRRLLAPADALLNRWYGWRFNPLYHSGALVVLTFVLLLITGLYLVFFYRLGSPHASIVRITEQAWLGRWIRSLHRYASDAAVVAAAVHALRMFAQDRSWGPRALAWVSGLLLVGLTFVLGWTGYVMVWDVQGMVLAREGARLMDALPLFAEPISRAFVGERELPSAFFFLNLFLHVALPIGLGALLWLHVSRVARAGLLPPRGLLWATTGALLALSVLWPAPAGTPADLFRLPSTGPYDAFYAFWLPLTQGLPAVAVWVGAGFAGAVAVLTPWWSRPRTESPRPSVVNERLCTGCEQCYLDCPYEAIAMVDRTAGRAGLVARVDPALCVSCGICAGSCAPMGVGPPGRTGRDQLARIRDFVAALPPGGDVVVLACSHGAGGASRASTLDGAAVLPVDCAGSLHTSVVEYLVRSGVGGVLIVACPPRDCKNREGPKWLEQRLYHQREAELKDRVDRRRVRLVHAGLAEAGTVAAELERSRREAAALGRSRREAAIVLDAECELERPEGPQRPQGVEGARR